MTSIITKAFRAIGKLFTAHNLTAAEAWIARVSPDVADDIMQISATLPGVFTSLETLAEETIKLVHDAKGVVISKTLAIQLAQSVLTGHWPEIIGEAEALLSK